MDYLQAVVAKISTISNHKISLYNCSCRFLVSQVDVDRLDKTVKELRAKQQEEKKVCGLFTFKQ